MVGPPFLFYLHSSTPPPACQVFFITRGRKRTIAAEKPIAGLRKGKRAQLGLPRLTIKTVWMANLSTIYRISRFTIAVYVCGSARLPTGWWGAYFPGFGTWIASIVILARVVPIVKSFLVRIFALRKINQPSDFAQLCDNWRIATRIYDLPARFLWFIEYRYNIEYRSTGL